MEHTVLIPIDSLHESPFNPRRTFGDAGLQELAASIAAEGVLQPIRVRPRMPNPLFTEHHPDDGYEIVFGHRRFRAAKLAGRAEVPCMVGAMTDSEASRAQIAENLQREDVHPIEEAEGFAALMREHGVTADQLVEQTGKSRSYVYGRLKLLQACPEVRNACLAGEIGSEVALLVARLRTDKLQQKALQAIKGRYYDMEDGGAKSTRQIRDLLNERFTLDLEAKDLLFDPADAALLPDAGSCTDCPKRAGNAPEYGDIGQATPEDDEVRGRHSFCRHIGPNICTDPDCFDEKKKAALKIKADAMRAEGKAVVDGAKARQAVDAHGNVKGAYIALKEAKAQLKALPKKGSAADQDVQQPHVVTIQDPRTGKTFDAVKREDLKAAGVEFEEPKAKASGCDDWREQQRRRDEGRARAEAKAKAKQPVRLALLQRVREAAAAAPRSAFDLQMVAQVAFEGVGYWDKQVLAKLWNARSLQELERRIGQLSLPDVTAFLLDCALVTGAHTDASNYKTPPEPLTAAAKHYGVDADAVRAEVQPPAQGADTPSRAARAPKKATSGAGAKKKTAAAKKKPSPKRTPAAKKVPAKAAVPKEEQTDDAGSAGGSDAQLELAEEAA